MHKLKSKNYQKPHKLKSKIGEKLHKLKSKNTTNYKKATFSRFLFFVCFTMLDNLQ